MYLVTCSKWALCSGWRNIELFVCLQKNQPLNGLTRHAIIYWMPMFDLTKGNNKKNKPGITRLIESGSSNFTGHKLNSTSGRSVLVNDSTDKGWGLLADGSSSLIRATLCMRQKALSLMHSTASAFSVSGINHTITALPENNTIKGFLSIQPKWAKGQNLLITVIGLMFLIGRMQTFILEGIGVIVINHFLSRMQRQYPLLIISCWTVCDLSPSCMARLPWETAFTTDGRIAKTPRDCGSHRLEHLMPIH